MPFVKMAYLKGWRYNAVIAGLVGAIAITLYPIVLEPMINCEKYKKIQNITRQNIKQEDVQPGNMNVWSDPFRRK